GRARSRDRRARVTRGALESRLDRLVALKRAGRGRRSVSVEPGRYRAASPEDGVVAVGARGHDPDLRADQLRDAIDVAARGVRKPREIAHARGRRLPARYRLVDGLAALEHADVGRELLDYPALVPVSRADADLLLGVEHVELGEADRVDAVHPHRVA